MLMYLSNRRNLLLRCSIIINLAVFLYAALHLSGSGPNTVVEWVPVNYDGPDKQSDFKLFIAKNISTDDDIIMDEQTRTTALKTSTFMTSLNKTILSTVSLADIERRIVQQSISSMSTVRDSTDKEFDLDQRDENILSDATLNRLDVLLNCEDKEFKPVIKQRGEYWSLVNFVRADHGRIACHETVTYTTHAGYEFLDNVLPLVERWAAPISIAIHAPGFDITPTIDSIKYLRDCTGTDLVKNWVTFHIFFSNKHIPSKIPSSDVVMATSFNCTLGPPYLNASKTYTKTKNLLYPVNVARNIARETALTHFVFASDIELYPSPNLVPRFLNMIARNDKPLNTSTNPRVFPISLFEVAANVKPPTNKTILQSMLDNKTAIPFHKFVCANCHNIPQGQQWMHAPETETMEVFHVGKRLGKFVHWEPIFIGTNAEPFYDERLSWDGKKDKMPQGYVLCVLNYDFMILNNAFLTHKPGIKRYKRNKNRDIIATKQSKFVNSVIMPELQKLFGTRKGCAI